MSHGTYVMSSTPMSAEAATESSGAVGVSMAFEVTTLPVADVDRAKAFYQGLGWRFDIDFKQLELSARFSWPAAKEERRRSPLFQEEFSIKISHCRAARSSLSRMPIGATMVLWLREQSSREASTQSKPRANPGRCPVGIESR